MSISGRHRLQFPGAGVGGSRRPPATIMNKQQPRRYLEEESIKKVLNIANSGLSPYGLLLSLVLLVRVNTKSIILPIGPSR